MAAPSSLALTSLDLIQAKRPEWRLPSLVALNA